MKLKSYITEISSDYGKGITFIDIDETIFQTKALIYVHHDGRLVRKLTNKEFNTYVLNPGESFSFEEFRDAELFKKTSIAIPKVVKRIKRMFKNLKIRGSKIVLLTARGDFRDKEVFLSTFHNVGIPINHIYVERVGNMKTGTTAERKKKTIMKYIKDGEYRRVRLIDDDSANLRAFIKLGHNLPQEIINKVKKNYDIPEGEKFPVIQFFALKVMDELGTIKRV